MPEPPVCAVLWDFGGVILTSPFAAFARYEVENGLPDGFLRRINATNPDDNAWARHERGEIDRETFLRLFAAEARALGHKVDAQAVLSLINGRLRPAMVAALRNVAAHYKTACLTNNYRGGVGDCEREREIAEVMALFDLVVESSRIGLRKPDPRFYRHACHALDVAPQGCVFLDDLGINLKPARAMGMRTIKVSDPDQALDALERELGHSVR